MNEDLDAIIGGAVMDAGLAEENDMGELVATEETPSVEGTPSTPDEGEAPPEPEVDADGKPVEKVADKPGEGLAEGDDLDKELQSLGVQSKDQRGGESRIRYSRIRKIWDNYKKKHEAEITQKHTDKIKEFETQATRTAQRIEYYDNLERIIKENPRRYVELLTMADPRFKEFFGPTSGGPAPVAATGDEKMPQPDAQFADGTTGYSTEGFQKALEWNTQRTMKLVEDRFKQQYGKPLENLTQSQRVAAERQMHETRIKQNVARAKQIYGPAFTEDFGDLGSVKETSAVMKVLKENPTFNFLDACAVALIPKIQGDRNTIRESILQEMKERPAAAKSSVPQGTRPAPVVPDTVEGVIAEQMKKAGMI